MDQCGWGTRSLGERIFPIPDNDKRLSRRDRQAAEIEANQRKLRTSIDTSKRLVDEADAMIQRHRREPEDGEAGEP